MILNEPTAIYLAIVAHCCAFLLGIGLYRSGRAFIRRHGGWCPWWGYGLLVPLCFAFDWFVVSPWFKENVDSNTESAQWLTVVLACICSSGGWVVPGICAWLGASLAWWWRRNNA